MSLKIDNDYIINTLGKNLVEDARAETTDAERHVRLYLDNLYTRTLVKVMEDDVTVTSEDALLARLDTEEKVELFKTAQAWQAVYEMSNGINALVLDEHSDVGKDWNRVTTRILRNALGFNRTTLFTAR